MIDTPKKLANCYDKIWDIWGEALKVVEDEDDIKSFSDDVDECETEEEAEKLFEEFIEYANDEIAGENIVFGIRKGTGDLGFWEEEDIDYDDEEEDIHDGTEPEGEDEEREEEDDESVDWAKREREQPDESSDWAKRMRRAKDRVAEEIGELREKIFGGEKKPDEPVRRSKARVEDKEERVPDKPKEGVAEILDEDGKVIDHTTYKAETG